MVWKMPKGEKKIYLTFDDGPVTIITEKVLEILDEHKVKATFFCVGENIKRNPQIFAKILEKNHAIGNHTYSHVNGWSAKSNLDFYNNIEKCNTLSKSTLFRPPHGKIRNCQARHLGKRYKIIMWSQLTADFDNNISPEKCLQNALNSSDGDIVVFHDSKKAAKNMLYALPRFLEYYLKKGFTFETLK